MLNNIPGWNKIYAEMELPSLEDLSCRAPVQKKKFLKCICLKKGHEYYLRVADGVGGKNTYILKQCRVCNYKTWDIK